MQISASMEKANQSIKEVVKGLGLITEGLTAITKNSGFEEFSRKAREFSSNFSDIGKQASESMKSISNASEKVAQKANEMGKSISESMKPINEQARKMTKDLSQTLSEFQNKYGDLGKGFRFTGTDSAIQKQVEKYTNALENAKLKKHELELSGKTEGQMYEYAVRDVLKYENVLESLKSQLSSVEVPHIDLSALNQEELNNWFNNLPTVAQQAAQSITSSLGQIEIPKIEGINTESLNYNANAMKAVFGEAASEIQNYTEAITRFGEQAGAVLNQPIKTDLSQMSTKELDEWFNNLPSIKAEVERAAQDINNTLNQIQQPRSINISTESLNYNTDAMKAVFGEAAEGIRNFQDAVQTLGSQAGKTLNESMSRMQEFGERLKNLEIPPIREDNLKKLQSSLEKTESKLNELRANLANGLEMGRITESVDDKNYVKLQEQIALTEKQAEALRAKIREVEQQSKTNWAQSLSNALGKVASFAKQAHTSLSRISSVLKRLNTGLNKAVGKFMSLGKSLSHVSKSSKKSELSLSKAFKMILRYGLGIRSVYVLFNRMRRAIIEGFKNLALYSDEVNASISMLKGSFETLKNSSAAALSPLLNAIAPALNAIIQLCIRATNAINQFLSAIFGKGYWIKAKDQVVDYADSIKKAGKEAKNGIRQFDELKLISTDSGGGGGADSNAGDMFETLPIEDRFKEAAEKTKKVLEDLFKPLKVAWDSEGKFVMDSWKYALDEIKKLAKDIGRDFLEVWNQEETIAMFEDILHIVGDIGLVVGNLAKNFREAWNTNDVGLHIFENIRDILAVIVHNIRLAADYTVKWSETLDFYPLLNKLKEWTESLIPVFDSLSGIVTDFYTQVLLPLAKWTLEQGIPDLLQVFIDFNSKVDWEALRSNLSEFWQHLEPFAETVGEGLIIFIDRVSDALANFLNSETFVNFLHSIEEWMDNVTPEDVADGIEKLAKAFIAFKLSLLGFAAVKTVLPIITNVLALSEKLSNFGGFAFSAGATAQVFDVFKNTKKFTEDQNAFDETTAKLMELKAQLDDGSISLEEYNQRTEEVKNELIDFTARDFKIPGVEYDENGWNTKLVELKNKISKWGRDINVDISKKWGTIRENTSMTFDNIKIKISTTWENIKTNASTVWENIKTSLSESWGTLKTDASTKFGEIKSNVSEAWENLKSDASDKWNTIKSNLSELWGETKENASNTFGTIKDSITDSWNELKENTSTVWDQIKNVIKNPINAIIGFINRLISGVVSGINGMTSALNNVSFDVPDWIPGIGGSTFGFNIPQISVPEIPMLATGAVFRGGKPFAAIVNDQPRGQTNIEAPLKVIRQALREELTSLIDNVQLTPTFKVGQFQPMPPPEFDFESRRQGVYEIAAEVQRENSRAYSNSDGYDNYSEEASLLMSQNQLLREQNRLLEQILRKPTMEISDVHKAIVRDSMERGGNIHGGNMGRLAVAQELYR